MSGRGRRSPGSRCIRTSTRAARPPSEPPAWSAATLVHDARVGSHGGHAAGGQRLPVAAPAEELALCLGARRRELAVLLDPHELARWLAHHGDSAVEAHYSITTGEFGDSEALLLGQLHPSALLHITMAQFRRDRRGKPR